MTNALVTTGYTQARDVRLNICLVDPRANVNLTNQNEHTLLNAMSTQANTLERVNASASREYTVRNVDNKHSWDNTSCL